MLFRIKGNVVGKTKIRDLNVELDKGQYVDMESDIVQKSKDIRHMVARQYITVERIAYPSSKALSTDKEPSAFGAELSRLLSKLDGISHDISDVNENFSGVRESIKDIKNRLDAMESFIKTNSSEIALKVAALENKAISAPNFHELTPNAGAVPKPEAMEPLYVPNIRATTLKGSITVGTVKSKKDQEDNQNE